MNGVLHPTRRLLRFFLSLFLFLDDIDIDDDLPNHDKTMM